MRANHALFLGAMGATEKAAARLDPVAYDLAPTMLAFRRQCMDGALKRVVIMGDTIYDNFQVFVVFISANFARCHDLLLFLTITPR